jgi:hypothetical protein
MARSRSWNLRRVLVAWNAVLAGAAIVAGAALVGTASDATAAAPDRASSADTAVRGLAGTAQPASLEADAVAAPATTASTVAAPTPPPSPPPAPVAPAPAAAPAPEPVPAPVPAPAPASEPAPAEDLDWRVQRALFSGVPEAWRAAVPTRLEVIPGTTSWAHGSGTISVATSHASGDFDHLVDVVVHEFGHLIAFRYGTGDYAGAGPAGWPAPAVRPEEAWADCVQTAFTGRPSPSHGLAPCGGEQLSWTANWLALGPPDLP